MICLGLGIDKKEGAGKDNTKIWGLNNWRDKVAIYRNGKDCRKTVWS